MNNTDKVVEYILSQAGKLKPDKIRALAEVVRALGGEVSKEPNNIPIQNDPGLLDEEEPLDLSQIEHVEFPGVGKRDVRIYE